MIRLFSLFIRTIIVLALLIGPVSALSGSVLAQEPTPNDNPGPGNNGPISIKSATVSNGVVQIGVHDYGNLVDNNTAIGLQYVPTGGDAITPGCWCEGWGVGDATSGAAGWADWAVGGFTNLSLVDFTSTGTTAISVVDVAGTLRVTHDFHPSPDTPFLYEVLVTMENISEDPVEPRYRRAMDWDIFPTEFSEYVTIETGNSTAMLYSSDNGFAIPNPFDGPSYVSFEGEAVDNGPDDHGALFDYGFDPLAPGESMSFYIYYGASGTETEALTALATVQAEVYSLGQPSSADGPDLGIPNTFIFGFKGVQGDPVFPEIDVIGNAVSIADGDVTPSLVDNTDFGSAVPSDGSTVDKSFFIENLGSADLAVSDISISGDNAGDFSLSGIVLPATIGLGESVEFVVTFDPSALGLRTAAVNITNTDADENPYDFAIQGMGNTPPVAQDDEYTVAQDSVDTLLEVLANDSDADSDPLTISAVDDPDHGTVVNQGTQLLYTPEAGYTGEDSFEYTVSDGQGGTDVGMVTITVAAGNIPPVAQDDEYTLAQDSVDNPLDVLANDSDADGDPLTISAVDDPLHGSVVNQGTELLYTPEAGYTGEDSFEYTVSDGQGGTDIGMVTITVAAGNIPPVAQDDEFTVAQDSADNPLDVLANDSDADSDPLTISAVDDPDHGTVVNQGTQLLYTPEAWYVGEDSFEYTVSDGQGGTDVGMVTITVAAGNIPPVAQDDEYTLAQDSADNPLDVLANDSDADSDPLTISAVDDPDHGTVVNQGTQLLYTPEARYVGEDSFEYTVSDGQGGTDVGMVTITVAAGNIPPVAQDDEYTLALDSVDNPLDVLANDSDANSDPLTISAVDDPDHGTVVNQGTQLLYTPDPGYTGEDSFEYTVSDGLGSFDTAAVTITVTKVEGFSTCLLC